MLADERKTIMRLETWIASALLALFASVSLGADKAAEPWDGLVEVKSKRLDAAFVAPGADFRPYSRLMVDPTQTAFHKDWMRNMNDRRDISRMVDSGQAQEILEAARTNFADVFQESFTKAGYTIVDRPGPDVLRVTPGVVNLYVNAPDVMSAGRSRSYTANAGEATMVLELRDSQTNALLGRVVDGARRAIPAHQGGASGQAAVLPDGRFLRTVLRGCATRRAPARHHADEARPVRRAPSRSRWRACPSRASSNTSRGWCARASRSRSASRSAIRRRRRARSSARSCAS
jgi:hypothetical protein